MLIVSLSILIVYTKMLKLLTCEYCLILTLWVQFEY